MTEQRAKLSHDEDPEVEAQLDEVMDTIRFGARPWQCDEGSLDELRAHYRPGFIEQKENWRRVRPKIIRLAKYQGALAALLAEICHGKISPPPYPIPRACMWLASFLVQLGCPPHVPTLAARSGDEATILGPHCPKIGHENLDGELVQQLQRYALDLLTGSGLDVTGSK